MSGAPPILAWMCWGVPSDSRHLQWHAWGIQSGVGGDINARLTDDGERALRLAPVHCWNWRTAAGEGCRNRACDQSLKAADPSIRQHPWLEDSLVESVSHRHPFVGVTRLITTDVPFLAVAVRRSWKSLS